jgi:hypothetical protein
VRVPRGVFKAWTRFLNPIVAWILRSPLHVLLSRFLLILTYTGRRSGREYTIVTSYSRIENGIRIGVGWPESKVWWRNFSEASPPVRVLLKGTEYQGRALSYGDEQSGVHVDVTLDGWAAI